MRYQLNTNLNLPSLHRDYLAKRRGQVRDFFSDDCAEQILQHLSADTPWGLAFNQGDRVTQLSAEQVGALTAEQQRQVAAVISEGARKGYQFLYHYYPLLANYFDPAQPRTPLFDVFEYLNSEPFLRFVRDLTGLRSIRWADAQATLFRAGHFLKYHTDENPRERRVAAYVLNFTKDWGRDWGGYLQFFNEQYDIEEGLRPVFNALNIFTVPAHHSVSQIANYAPGNRFSITGWLREDEPPGPFRRAT
ncbi:MAG: 2OG-Fe(II) oxygenase [Pseudomonadota bacterium]|nr:2OG-Fe(II) oxygenase [Pseudomonadota bacterium]